MLNLQILTRAIRTFENLYSLNDLHVASGNLDKHRPTWFVKNQQTQDLITEIEKQTNSTALKTIRGTQGGTYACKEIVIAYAAWISPQFHLVVLRAFLNQVEQPKQLALPEPEKKYPFNHTEQELQQLAWEWFALFKCVEFTHNLIPALDSIQSNFAARAHGIVSEYGSMLRRHQPLIQKLTADFHVETWGDEKWNRVLPTIRDNDILRPKRRLGDF
ncbi:bacteriocin [Actinobacillus seminis]|uniref:Antirepressor protein n=2 Tax=Actinobacillus seminis TaxID=722 RepID=A0A263HBQ2_9PAST|nr:P22AR C-terminal domain-containing protein [Actinobacillus seminis]OZN24884.1 bacteriocin [Actinobacillus seminis]SUU36642.1 antirepressor protein [Actinobacillus seminis]